MAFEAQNVSVTLPVTQAIEQVKRILFTPFEFEKWLTIGFCAWLAHLGQSGFRGTYGGGGHHGQVNTHEWTQRVHDYVISNLYWLVPVAAAVVALGLAILVLIVWVSSRGKFMFLHCVARNRAEVVAPWQNFSREAASLFWFRLSLVAVQMLALLPLGTAIGIVIWNMAQHGAAVGSILVVVALGSLVVAVCMVALIIGKFTTDFVVPVMFLHGGTCLQGWAIVRGLMASNPGGIVLYLLFQLLLSIAIGASVLALVLLTCCIAGCLLALPYIGTVFFLPVLVFQRAYSAFYLRQYGPDYDVFAEPGLAAPASGSQI